ncbi:MAG TPA: hypothetical protein VNQ76_11935 [Planctomicrobium sp.]|nr:hypothetical protein [Planctomicrobium sp.]
MIASPKLLLMCVSLMIPAIVGCERSSGPKRHTVQGTVIYQGALVPEGEIRFTPDVSQGNTGPGAIAEIRGGRFQTESGRGVISGPHVVTITGFDGIDAQNTPNLKGNSLFPPFTTNYDFSNKTSDVKFEVENKK